MAQSIVCNAVWIDRWLPDITQFGAEYTIGKWTQPPTPAPTATNPTPATPPKEFTGVVVGGSSRRQIVTISPTTPVTPQSLQMQIINAIAAAENMTFTAAGGDVLFNNGVQALP
ncbi:MAG: hypothetical protein LC754_10395 [Acidobacteria bacterium]|nr:hypothetical protein [Acidobacteriota bacterium]